MTIDLEGPTGFVSVRGTIAENNLMISRINDFERVYFVPKGECFDRRVQGPPRRARQNHWRLRRGKTSTSKTSTPRVTMKAKTPSPS